MYVHMIHKLINFKSQVGHTKGPGGKSYWFSWDSDEDTLRNARWNWFTARNYCR